MKNGNRRSGLERTATMRPWAALSAVVVGLACASGCLDVIGYRDHAVGDPFGTAAGGTSTGGGDGGTTTSGCEPGTMVSCYTGPAETKDKGICEAGTQTCGEDGMPAGTCKDQVTPGVETCATMEDDDCDGSDCGIWSEIFSPKNWVSLSGMAVDPKGDLILVGRLLGTVSFGDVALQATGIDGSMYVVKLDKTGKVVWGKTFGDAATTSVYGRVAVDVQGDVVLAGYFEGSLSFGGDVLTDNDTDIFVAKLSRDGEHVWSRAYGAAAPQRIVDLATDSSGNVLLFGEYYGTFNMGALGLAYAGESDVFVAKLAGFGAVLWAKNFGDSQIQSAGAIAVDATDNPVIVGINSGTINFGGKDLTDGSLPVPDVFLAKLKGTGGTETWSEQFVVDADSFAFPAAIALDPSYGVILGGAFNGNLSLGGPSLASAGGTDLFLARLDSSGSHVWSRRFGGAGYEGASGVAVDAAGRILLSAQSDGKVDFGGGPLTSAGSTDIFLASFDGALGKHNWSRKFGNKETQNGAFISASPGDTMLLASVISGKGTASSVDFGNGPLIPDDTLGLVVAKIAP